MQAGRTLRNKKKEKVKTMAKAKGKKRNVVLKKPTAGGEQKARANLKDIRSFLHKAKHWKH